MKTDNFRLEMLVILLSIWTGNAIGANPPMEIKYIDQVIAALEKCNPGSSKELAQFATNFLDEGITIIKNEAIIVGSENGGCKVTSELFTSTTGVTGSHIKMQNDNVSNTEKKSTIVNKQKATCIYQGKFISVLKKAKSSNFSSPDEFMNWVGEYSQIYLASCPDLTVWQD